MHITYALTSLHNRSLRFFFYLCLKSTMDADSAALWLAIATGIITGLAARARHVHRVAVSGSFSVQHLSRVAGMLFCERVAG